MERLYKLFEERDKDMTNKKYKKKGVSKEWLISHGFRLNREYSDICSNAYTYIFPVYKYRDKTILECELCIFLEDGEVKINVYEQGTKEMYPSYYNDEFAKKNNEVLKIINRNILNKLKNLGVKEIDE